MQLATRTSVLEGQTKKIRVIIGAKGDFVIIGGAFDDLLERAEVHAEGHVAVTSEGIVHERSRLEVQRDKGNVRVVHRLQFLKKRVSCV